MPTHPVIAIRNLNHHFGTGNMKKQVLFELTLEILPGEIVIVTGPSGSGKTTLLTLIGALRTVQEGSLRVLGEELRGVSAETQMRVRRQVGFVFQAHHLLNSLTACENVSATLAADGAISAAAACRQSQEILATVGLRGHEDSYPPHLSGGQKQRVAIARALVGRPKIVLADEPTAALDKKTGREVVDLLHQLARKQGCAILLVTHDHRILDVADRILTLEDGRISSFAKGITDSTSRLLATFALLNRNGELGRHIEGLAEPQFIQALKQSALEFEQLLRALDLGNREAIESMLDQLLGAFSKKNCPTAACGARDAVSGGPQTGIAPFQGGST